MPEKYAITHEKDTTTCENDAITHINYSNPQLTQTQQIRIVQKSQIFFIFVLVFKKWLETENGKLEILKSIYREKYQNKSKTYCKQM